MANRHNHDLKKTRQDKDMTKSTKRQSANTKTKKRIRHTNNTMIKKRKRQPANSVTKKGSDLDTMFVVDKLEAIPNVRNIKHPIYRDILEMETDINHPGFTRLSLVAKSDRNSCIDVVCNCLPGTCTSELMHMSVNVFHDIYKQYYENFCLHDPCISNKSLTVDHAYCISTAQLNSMGCPSSMAMTA
ncbi:unnamed protein product [Mytilus coruscus]|uniref:Uncharacterized protein n=1 Tax=Mytilus coruscus TaxID=42192 RepID=A0A6J8AWH7_MYTCO|nr:unnamed protein product [Mytilus coruscus]